MFAVGVDDVNFWHESPGVEGPPRIGRQKGNRVVCRIDRNGTGRQLVSVTQGVDWVDDNDNRVIREQREIHVECNHDANATLLTWRCELMGANPDQPPTFNGERYFGLGLRFVEPMDDSGTHLLADDRGAELAPDAENLVQASWCAYQSSIDGNDVTVAVFARRDNPRGRTVWFTMTEPFAYIAATLGLDKRPLVLPPDGALTCVYGVAAADGKLTRDQIDNLYRAWSRKENAVQ